MRKRNSLLLVLSLCALVLVSVGSARGAASSKDGPKAALQRRGDAPRSDAWMTKQVRHQLLMLPYYSVFDDLGYRVNGDRVELYGDVTRPSLKSDAENAVKRIEGVRGVDNQIHVLPASFFDDQIRIATYRAIYGYPALRRYAIGSNPPIRIIVDNGNVRLIGYVDSQMDKQIAYMRASSVPGTFSVSDELRID